MDKSFRKILCPVDFDENSMAALELAIQLAKGSGGLLYLIHVDSGPLSRPVFPTAPGAVPSEEMSRSRLAKIAHERLAGKVRYEVLARFGAPFEVITQAAEEVDADVVVMATHGRTGAARLVLGSVAEHVVRTCSRPVLTVRPNQRI